MAEFGSQTGWKDDIRIAPGDRQQAMLGAQNPVSGLIHADDLNRDGLPGLVGQAVDRCF